VPFFNIPTPEEQEQQKREAIAKRREEAARRKREEEEEKNMIRGIESDKYRNITYTTLAYNEWVANDRPKIYGE
jgi:hypothetical protein